MSDRKPQLLLACATVLCVVALYLKQPHIFALPQFYAEDGRFFFADAYNEGWRSLFYTANGYFHLLPRLLANLTLTLGVPYAYIPAVFVYGCLPIYFILWLKIFTRLQLAPEAKLFLALSTVLVPLGNEIFMNQTNVQWVMALIPVVLFCGDAPQRPWSRIADYGLLVLCVFTGPYVLFLLPVFVLITVLERRVSSRWLFLGICAVAMTACLFTLAHFGTVDRIRGATRWTWYGWARLAFRSYYFPVFSTYVDEAPEWAVVAMAAVLPILLAFAGRAVARSKNRFARVAFTAGLLLFFATAVSYGRNPDLPSPFASAIRNFYLPMVLLLWSLIAITRFERRRIAALTVAFAWFAVQISFIPESRRIPDLRWEVYAERLKSGAAMKIPITPAGWNMELRERTSPPR
ncbi:MAG TPA: hypothetical protein VN700_14645 [Vicinamibacterales bacterium]|nr:hypothetical protein [Vicinamibacterales bacterium]